MSKKITNKAIQKQPSNNEEEPEQNNVVSTKSLPISSQETLQRQENEDEPKAPPTNMEQDSQASNNDSVQRQIDDESSKDAIKNNQLAKSTNDTVENSIQRQAGIGSGSNGQPATVDSNTESYLNNTRGGGQPLSESSRAFMEPRFGQDFSGVRVHTDSRAANAAKGLNAQAFTRGRDIYFGEGRYQPGTEKGQRLLGHELTHVVQQGGSIKRNVAEEKEAAHAHVQTKPIQNKIQRQNSESGGFFSNLWSGARRLGSQALRGLQRLSASTLSSLRRLGSGVMETLEQMGEAALEWGPRLAAIAMNPAGALAGGLWLSLPDRFKPGLINAILDNANTIVEGLRGGISLAIGPLWPLILAAFSGFIRRMRQVSDTMKIRMSNRLAQIVSGGSLTFILYFFKGLGLAVWDVIRTPYDLVVGIIDGVRMIARFLSNLTMADLLQGITLLQTGLSAAWDGLRQMVRNPRQAIRFVQLLWNSIQQAAGQIGRGLAEAILRFFRLSDAQMGEQTGRFAGSIAIDIALSILLPAVGGALRRALASVQQFMRLFRAGRRGGRLMRMIRPVINPLLTGIRNMGNLFRRGPFGRWLRSFREFLSRMLNRADEAISNARQRLRRRGRHRDHDRPDTDTQRPPRDRDPDTDQRRRQDRDDDRRRREDDERESPGERARAQISARRITEYHDQRNTPVRSVLRRLFRLKRRYRWIHRFEARPKNEQGQYSVYMIASGIKVKDYDENDDDIEQVRREIRAKLRSPFLRRGRFARRGGSIATSHPRIANVPPSERTQIQRRGELFGDHHTGVRDPGTNSGNWIPDHIPVTELVMMSQNNNELMRLMRAARMPTHLTRQRLYPHSWNSSQRQGGTIRAIQLKLERLERLKRRRNAR